MTFKDVKDLLVGLFWSFSSAITGFGVGFVLVLAIVSR